jgi:hypothetical protein
MAQSVQNRPGSQDEEEDQIYDPQGGALGDPTDPRGDLPPGVSMGEAGDPSAGMRGTPRPQVYDTSGAHYDEDEKSKVGKLRKGLGLARSAAPGISAANKVRKKLKKNEEGSGRGAGSGAGGSSSPSDLGDAESRGDFYNPDDLGGGLFNDNDKASRRQRAGKFLRRHKKKGMIGGGIMTGVIGGGLGLFLILLPLKIEHIVDNLEGSFFSSSQQALGTETRNMIKGYLISRVMPGYKNCGSTIKPGCSAHKFGSSPVANLYNTWADARVERTLADKGIVLEYKRLPGKWYLETPHIKSGAVDIGANGERLGIEIDNHAELRAALDKTVKDETKWYQVYQRFKWGRYFERKFGLPRCIIVCHVVGKNKYDAFHGKIHEKKIAAKLIIVQRVITPHNQTLGIVLECLITDCAAADNEPSGTDGENGTPRSATDAEITDSLRKYGGSLAGNVSDEELLKNYKDIEEKGLQKYLITKTLTPIIGETAAGTAGDVIPIAGWVNLAAQIINTSNDASGSLKKLRFEVLGVGMAAMAATWMVYADECHSGNCDATELGSFAQTLGPGDQGSTNGPPVGGTGGAEQSKLYQNLIDKTGSAATGAASSASDIASGAAGEICQNGLPVPAGQLICNEEFLGGGNSLANGIHDFLNLPGVDVITLIAQGWKDSIGLVFKYGGDLLGSIFNTAMEPINASCGLPDALNPFGAYCVAKGEAEKAIPTIVKGITTALIPDPFGVPMGATRNFAIGAGGFDYTGNDSAHRLLGAQAITPGQKAQIVSAQQQEEQMQFSHQSFFARMFNGDSQYSLVSKLAMDMPFGGPGVAIQSGLADLLNPLGILSHGFGSIFSGKASADATPQDDPFGVTQYGYPIGTIPGDPSAYWDSHCSDNQANAYQKDDSWIKAASGESNSDPATGEPLNKKPNPCLLIMATVGADGGLYDTSNLTKDDLTDLNGSGGAGAPTGSTPAGSTVPPGGVAFPFPPQVGVVPPSSWTEDQGVDIATDGSACGKDAPEVAMGDGKIVGRGISGFGPDAPILKITDGPLNGRYIYYGHAGDKENSNGAGRPPKTEVGDTVKAGQVITYTGCGDVPSPAYSSGPHLEIGIWPKGKSPGGYFPSMNETSSEMMGILKNAYVAQGSK